MQAWSASPYRAIGVYVDGVNRTCAQPELTPAWVAAVAGLGWRLLPTGELPSGALAWVVCQQAGSRVANTRVWDKISYRHWVSDHYVATPSKTGFSKPAPRC